MTSSRPVVLYGASGSTGRLVAEYLREFGVPFVAAGRNKARIQQVMDLVPAPAEPATASRAKTTAEAAAEPRWLTEQERAGWLATVALMSRLPAALDARMQSDAGLNFFDYMVLAMLSEQPDRTLQMSELAAVTSASLVGSDRGALPGLLPVGFPGRPAEPGVRFSPHRALCVSFPLG